MAEPENLIGKPGIDGSAEVIEFAREEVIGSFHNDEVVFARQRTDECPDLLNRAVFVSAAVHEEFRFVAAAQERKIAIIDRNPQAD